LPLPPPDDHGAWPFAFTPQIDVRLPDLDIDLSGLVHVPNLRLPNLSLNLHGPQPPDPPVIRRRVRSRELYEQAQHSIDEGRYERALEQLDRLIQQFDGTTETTALANKVDGALYWKAYALIKQKQIAEALGTLDVMQKKFAASRWMKDAKALELEARQTSGQSLSPDLQADEEIRLLALRGLMQGDPDRVVPMIEKLLASGGSVRVKENALFVLTQSQSPRAREVITGVARGSGNPDLQLRAVRYLGAIGGADNRKVLEEVYRSTSDLSLKREVIRSFVPSGDRTRLLSIAKSEPSPELRGEAVRQLGAMGASTELADLYASESSTEVKQQIIQGLMVGRAPDRLADLARKEKDETLRRAAIRNLGVMNQGRTGDVLRGLYANESSVEVKKEIVNALFIQRNAAALVELARNEKDAALRREIVSKLSLMRDKAATDYLLELLQ
jgi:hypothetical protein